MTRPPPVRIGAFALDDVANRLIGDGESRPISPLAARLLAMLAEHRGEPVPRAAIIRQLWADNHYVGETALNRLVSETRKALDDSPRMPRIIQTVPRVGYRLVDGEASAELPSERKGMWGGWRWLAALLILLLVASLVANWLMEQAIGLEWMRRNGG